MKTILLLLLLLVASTFWLLPDNLDSPTIAYDNYHFSDDSSHTLIVQNKRKGKKVSLKTGDYIRYTIFSEGIREYECKIEGFTEDGILFEDGEIKFSMLSAVDLLEARS